MLLSAKDLMNARVMGTDGELGKLLDLFVDYEGWLVRYLVVDSGPWLNGRRVLLSLHTMQDISEDTQTIHVSLSQDMVRNSPDFSGGPSISRGQEVILHNYYRWPFYWEDTPTLTGSGVADVPLIELAAEVQGELAKQQEGNANLRSAQDFFGLDIQERDGEIGELEDFLFGFESHRLDYWIVATGGWLSERKVLVSPSFVETIDWDKSEVAMDLSQETIRNSPEYNPAEINSPDFLSRMSQHQDTVRRR